jgi:hypothetical protein
VKDLQSVHLQVLRKESVDMEEVSHLTEKAFDFVIKLMEGDLGLE